MEKWIRSKIVYKGNIFSVRAGEVKIDNGSIFPRQVVENPGGVGIVPIINNSIILVRQFRISINRAITEIPAGRLEPNELPETCALRELEEEIGYIAGKMELLAEYYTAVGFSTEKMFIYLATELQKGKLKPEVDERMDIITIPIKEIKLMLFNKGFDDSKTIIGLREALIKLENMRP